VTEPVRGRRLATLKSPNWHGVLHSVNSAVFPECLRFRCATIASAPEARASNSHCAARSMSSVALSRARTEGRALLARPKAQAPSNRGQLQQDE
jgi:hypothetical protein